MGINTVDNFCNCENNDSRFEASFRTSPNQNSDRLLCPFINTVIYQNYTIDNNNNTNNISKNRRNKNKNNKEKIDMNNYEMNFEFHSTKNWNDLNTVKHRNRGIFNLNPVQDDDNEEKKSNKSNQNLYNNEIIDNEIIKENNDNEDNIIEKEENNEIKDINMKNDNIEINNKCKNLKSHNSSDNSYNSEAPTTNLDKPNKATTPKNGVDIQYLGKNTFYIGYIQYGTREGFGKMVTGNNVYSGEFSNDQANGYGIYKKKMEEN